MGILDDPVKSRALTRGLLAMGQQLAQAGAPSTMPGGSPWAAGGSAFVQGIDNSLEASRQKQIQDMKVKHAREQMERQKLQQLARDRLANISAMDGKDMAGRPVSKGLLVSTYQQAFPEEYAKHELGAMFAGDKERKIIKGADGFNYFADTQERVLPGVQASPGDQKTGKDVNGVLRYLGTGKPVFPGVQKAEKPGEDKSFDNETKLRKEFTDATKDFVKVRDAYSRVAVSAKDPSAAGDLALIFNYMKILDPGSTVREGEFASAQNAAGVPDQVRNLFNRVMSGERLGVEQRGDFVDRAQRLYDQQQTLYGEIENRYRSLAGLYNLNPERVIYDMTRGTPVPTGPDDMSDLPPLPPGFKVIR